MRFGRKGKLAPQFIGPYNIIWRMGPLAYELTLPTELDRIHNVFHVIFSYIDKTNQVIQPDEIKLERDLTFMEKLTKIKARQVCQLRSKEIPMLKVIWKYQDFEAPTWENEATMKECYLEIMEDYLAGTWERIGHLKTGGSWP